jgi:hypothetical protein
VKRISIALLLVAVACSKASSSDNAGDAGAEATAPFVSTPIWKPTSKRVELVSGGFFDGISGYRKDRADLSADQLSALAGIRTIEQLAFLPEDGVTYDVTVFDEDGTSAKYRSYRTQDSTTALGFDTLTPFLNTLHCLASKSAGAAAIATDGGLVDPSTIPLEAGIALPTDRGCLNGVFFDFPCATAVFTIAIAEPVTYEITSAACLGGMSARIFAADQKTLLAKSTPGTGGSCFSLQYDFIPGSYVITLERTGADGCATQQTVGDTLFAVAKPSP